MSGKSLGNWNKRMKMADSKEKNKRVKSKKARKQNKARRMK